MRTTIMKRRLSGAESMSSGPLKFTKTDQRAEKEAAITDTQQALHYIQSLFPCEAFHTDPPLPKVVLKHQLYSLLSDRTAVDREIASLKENGTVRLFKLGVSECDYAVVEEDSYQSYLQAFLQKDPPLSRKLIQGILPRCTDVSVTRQKLVIELGVREDQLSVLVRHGVLLVRDVGKTSSSWWFAIPGVSPFIKSLTKGRSMVQQVLRKSKYKELLQSELESRKFSVSKLNMEYHIHDLIGSDLVESVRTTSGPLLRLVKDKRTHNR